MITWKIFHNPNCSKCRQSLEILKENGISPTVIEYLKNPPSKSEILQIIKMLEGAYQEIVRVKESEFTDNPFDLTDVNLIAEKLSETPKLIERPIIISDSRAVIARPIERLKSFLNI